MHGVQIEYSTILKNPANWNSKAIWYRLHTCICLSYHDYTKLASSGLAIFLLSYCVDSCPSDRFCWQFQVSFLQEFSPLCLFSDAIPGQIIILATTFGDPPSAEITKGCTDTLLSFQIFFDFQGKFFIFRNFPCPFIRKVTCQVNFRILQVLFLLSTSMSTISLKKLF
jgi:hypothetical protein